jgi:RHH-type proline utilization regulon transcriptional repressor/proline dehydrogenase/delta 1-pyrroline-5-carboxylate dehydrogenase
MLSGMSEHVSRMFAQEFNMNVLLYLPFGSKEDFISAIGYLVRRLDENTSRDNYLRYVNGLNQENLKMHEEKFEESLYLKKKNPNTPNSQFVKYMHGINRISILLFLVAMVILAIKLLRK